MLFFTSHLFDRLRRKRDGPPPGPGGSVRGWWRLLLRFLGLRS